MKWGTKYGPDYVNRLFNMSRRNLTVPFSFICYTDAPEGLDPAIDARPLPEMGFDDPEERGWRKLALFKKDIDLEGRVLFLDLDTVIVGNIDDYFTLEGEVILIKHWRPSKKHGVGETGVYRFDAGREADIYDNFINNISEVKSSYRHEQAYVGDYLSSRGRLSFWPEKWMPSFKYNCMRPFLLGLFLEPKLPAGAKMVVFHGNPTPSQAMEGRVAGLKGLVRFVRTPGWLRENWR